MKKLRLNVFLAWALLLAGTVQAAPINGMLIDLPSTSPQNVKAIFDDAQQLGIQEVLIQYTRVKQKGSGCGAGSFSWAGSSPDIIGTILDAAQARGMVVTIGLSLSCNECVEFVSTSTNIGVTNADTEQTARYIHERWGNHPAFVGWYFPDEPGLPWSNTRPYYRGLVSAVRKSGSKLPTSMSADLTFPALKPGEFTPQAVADMAVQFISATGIDMILWQDSAGASATNLGWRYGAKVKDYFQALMMALPNHTGAILELFNGPLNTGGYDTGHGAYKPAALARINHQWYATANVPRRLSYIPQAHMTYAPGRLPEAARLRAAYAAGYRGLGIWIIPKSYSYIPGVNWSGGWFPDETGKSLFDGATGDPLYYADGAWVGAWGDIGVSVNLGKPTRVDYIGVHVGQWPSLGIQYPLSIGCTLDGKNIGTISLPFARGVKAAEYVMSNPQPFKATGQVLQLTIRNVQSWTFASEIELISLP